MIALDQIITALDGKKPGRFNEKAKLAFARELLNRLDAQCELSSANRKEADKWHSRLKKQAKEAADALEDFQNNYLTSRDNSINHAAIAGLMNVDLHQLQSAFLILDRIAKSSIRKTTGQDRIPAEMIARFVARLYKKHFSTTATHNRQFETSSYRANGKLETGYPTPFDRVIFTISTHLKISFSEKVLRDVCKAEKRG